MKNKNIFIFIMIIFMTFCFVISINIAVNPLQAADISNIAYVQNTDVSAEIIELTPKPAPTEANEKEGPNPELNDEVDNFEINEEEILIEESVIVEEEFREDNGKEEEPQKENIIEEESQEKVLVKQEYIEDCFYRVEIIANIPIGSVVNEGDIITMTAVLYGFDNLTVTYQWYRLVGADWVSIENATAQSYSFAATEETVDCWYNVYVTIVE